MKLALILVIAAVTTAAVVLIPAIPLGVPGEWTWSRHSLPTSFAEAADRLVLPLLAAGAILAFAGFIERRISAFGVARQGLSVLLLSSAMFLWMSAVRQAAPSPHRELRPLWVLYDRFATGYFHEACFHITSQRELLEGYEARVSKGDVLHEGTHPPGLFLTSWWMLQATRSSSSLTAIGEHACSADSASLFRTLESGAAMERPLTREEFATLSLLALLSSLLTAATVIPVYGLVRHLVDSRTAWRAACLAMTPPALAVFAPRSDVVYAFSATMLLWLMVLAVDATCRRSRIVLSGATACWAFLCLATSLAHLPVVVAGFLYGMLRVVFAREKKDRVQIVVAFAVMLVGGLGCVAVCDWLTECNLLTVWSGNLRNHQAFYSTSIRTWWKWLLVNPIELAMSLGLPLAIVAFTGVAKAVRGLCSSDSDRPAAIFAMSVTLVWLLLLISGKNAGEAARLWCFLTPWFAICGALGMAHFGKDCRTASDAGRDDSQPREARTAWLAILSVQFVVATLTTGVVNGYLQL